MHPKKVTFSTIIPGLQPKTDAKPYILKLLDNIKLSR